MGWITKRLGYGVSGTVDGNTPTDAPHVVVDGPGGAGSPTTVAIDQTGDNNDVDVVATVLPPGAATDTTLQTIDTDLKATQPRSITNFPAIQQVGIDQSGDNNDVDVVSSVLPTGAALDSSLTTIDNDIKGSQPRKLQDGSGVAITSQTNGSQRALDVGIDVAGVQVDPRVIRALTSADVVTVNNFPSSQQINGTVAANPTVNSRVDTYTTPASGVTVDVHTTSAKVFAIQVKGTGAIASAWVVVLEGSLDNVNFTTILTHNTATGDGVILFSGASAFPCLYFRSRLVSDTLGLATNLVVTIMGTS